EWEYLDQISKCERIVANTDSCYQGYLALSLLFKVASNLERRKTHIQEALKINNTINRIWREYAETNYQLGNMSIALQQFQEAIRIDTKDAISFEGIGLCYYYLDEPFKALNPLKKALTFQPENHIIMNHLSFILSEIGEVDEAHDLILQALELKPNNNIYLDTYACILFLQDKHEQSLKVFERILENKPKEWEVSWDILFNVYDTLGLHVKAKQIEEKMQIK
ncbi:MAG: tetratricopeptide repeat protein, partial [Candidatus Thorarchaeota archaeon]